MLGVIILIICSIRKLGEIWKKSFYLMASVIFVIAASNLLSKEIQMATFKFASLQSEIGQKLLKQYGFDKEIDSFVLIENQIIYSKSSAALRVCRNLNGLWKVFAYLRILPFPLETSFTI